MRTSHAPATSTRPPQEIQRLETGLSAAQHEAWAAREWRSQQRQVERLVGGGGDAGALVVATLLRSPQQQRAPGAGCGSGVDPAGEPSCASRPDTAAACDAGLAPAAADARSPARKAAPPAMQALMAASAQRERLRLCAALWDEDLDAAASPGPATGAPSAVWDAGRWGV
jgi:hypothetical protein